MVHDLARVVSYSQAASCAGKAARERARVERFLSFGVAARQIDVQEVRGRALAFEGCVK